MRYRGRALFFALLLAGACDEAASSAPPPRTPETAPALPAELASDAPLEFVERTTGGALATDTLPMIVAIHGLGDRPEHAFETMYASLPVRARVILPRAPLAWGDGFAWFPYHAGELDAATLEPPLVRGADRIDALVTRLAATRPTEGKPIVVGFSQGGMLSYTLAARHGEHYRLALPLSGFLLPHLAPPRGCAGVPPIWAAHGDADGVVQLEWDQRGQRALTDASCHATLHVLPGVGHQVTPELLALIAEQLRAVAPSATSSPEPRLVPTSRIFTIPGLGAPGVPARDVVVRVPAAPPGAKLPVLFVYDGEVAFDELRVGVALDDLVAHGAIRPWIVVALPSVDRRYELADDAARTASFVADVVLPAVAARVPVDLHRESIAIAGFSYGGLAAVRAAIARPDVFGRIVAQSPSLWWHGGAPIRELASPSARLPVRMFLDVGTNEQRNPQARPYMTDDARHLRDVLIRRGMTLGTTLGYHEDVGSPHGFDYAGARIEWALAFALSDVDLAVRSADDVTRTPFGPPRDGRVAVEARYAADRYRLTWPEGDTHPLRN